MPTRYWVSAAPANWSSNSWSGSSGGAPDGLGPPTINDDAIFDANGAGNCTADVAPAMRSITTAGYAGTLSFGANAPTIGSAADPDSGDGLFTGPGTINCGTGTWNVWGDFDDRGGTWNRETCHIRFRRSATTQTRASGNFYFVTIDAGATINHTAGLFGAIGLVSLNGALILGGLGAVFAAGLAMGDAATLTVNADSAIYANQATFTRGTGTTVNGSAVLSIYHSIAFPAGDYECHVRFVNASAQPDSVVTLAAGATRFLGHLTAEAALAGGSLTIANATNNPSITVRGNLTLLETAGTLIYQPSSQALTLDGSADQTISLAGKTIEKIKRLKTAGTVTYSGAGDTITFADDNGQTIASETYSCAAVNAGNGSLVCTGNLTNTAGCTYTKQGSSTTFSGSAAQALTSAGDSFGPISVAKTGNGLTLADNLACTSFRGTSGQVNTNGKSINTGTGAVQLAGCTVSAAGLAGTTITCGEFLAASAAARMTLNPSSAWTLTASGTARARRATISRCNAGGGNPLIATRSVNGGNNTNCTFRRRGWLDRLRRIVHVQQ